MQKLQKKCDKNRSWANVHKSLNLWNSSEKNGDKKNLLKIYNHVQ